MDARRENIMRLSNQHFDLQRSEAGAGTLWAMLFCLIAVFIYLRGGQAYLLENVDPIYHVVVIVSLAVAAFFTIGCTLHLIIKGDKSTRRLRREMKNEIVDLEKFVVFARGRIDALNDEAAQRYATFRPHGRVSLEMAQRIVNAIERRAHDLNMLLTSNNKFDIIDAHELLEAHLEVVENCVDSLIAGDPIKPLPREAWFDVVDELISEVDIELERAAA